MTARIKTYWLSWAVAGLILVIAAPVRAEVSVAPFLDTLVAKDSGESERLVPVALIAPELPALRTELPATVIPAEHLDRMGRRLSDLNGDNVVDERDAAALAAALGPCPGGAAGCPGDLNRDGTVDATDQATLQRHLGTNLAGSEEAFPDRVGYLDPAPANLLPPLPAAPRADGWKIVRLELHSADAAGLRLQFADFVGATGLEVRIYDPAGPAVFGPYQNPRRGEDGTWWTPIIFGDAIGVEIALAPGAGPPPIMPKVTSIAYLFCDGTQCHSAPGTAMACHNDITCNSSWADNEGRAVGLLYFNSGGGCSSCSGALLNRGPGDLVPIFMTANHCINTQAEADTAEVLWHYNTPTCNGTPPNYNTLSVSEGAIMLKRHPESDWTLLGLLEDPAGDVYLGWDAGNWASGGAATGVHHPRGTFKRISTGTSAGTADDALFCDSSGTVPCTCNGSPSTCISVDVFNVSYTSGTTEPGSSGSPVFDSVRRVRGTLTGGPSGCATITARYGRLDLAFVNLRYFLNDADIPAGAVYVNGALIGDTGNAGNNERGTALNPFNGVAEATFCVRSGQEVRITPGNYGENFSIRRPMTLRREGAAGVVRIGN